MSKIPTQNDECEVIFKTTDRVEAARWLYSSRMALALWKVKSLVFEERDNEDEPQISEELAVKIYECIDDLDEFSE